MKKGIWDFGQKELDEQTNLMKKYTNLVEKDTDGIFVGDLVINREYMLSVYSIWIYSPKNPKLRIKFFELKRADGNVYPVTLSSVMEGSVYECANIEELDKHIVESISSEKVSIALSTFLNKIK